MSSHRLQGERRLRGDLYVDETVYLDGQPLTPDYSLTIYNHSPTGFSWGYLGSGPSQLALAVLLELMPVDLAKQEYQQFKEAVIANLTMGCGFDILFDLDTYEFSPTQP